MSEREKLILDLYIKKKVKILTGDSNRPYSYTGTIKDETGEFLVFYDDLTSKTMMLAKKNIIKIVEVSL